MFLSIGIDPGRYGCIWGWSDVSGHGLFIDTRDVQAVVDAAKRILIRAAPYGNDCVVAVERNHSMPGMPHHSAFTFGASYGGLLAALAAQDIKPKIVSAVTWRKWALGRVPKDRKIRDVATIEEAQRRWRSWDWPKSKKWCEAQAAAMFISAWAAQKFLGRQV